MKTELEIMDIRLAAFHSLLDSFGNGQTPQWYLDMFIYNRNGRTVKELVYGEPPHNRKEA